MKRLYLFLFVCIAGGASVAQQPARAQNLVIFLMDGYRWRELFQGADSGILFDHRYNHIDSAWTVKKYWDADAGLLTAAPIEIADCHAAALSPTHAAIAIAAALRVGRADILVDPS